MLQSCSISCWLFKVPVVAPVPKEGGCHSVIMPLLLLLLFLEILHICRPPSSTSLKDAVSTLPLFHKLYFHGTLGCRWVVLQSHAKTRFLLLLITALFISFLTSDTILGASLCIALGEPKVFPFPVLCPALLAVDDTTFYHLTGKLTLFKREHSDERGSPCKVLCVIADDVPSCSNEVLPLSVLFLEDHLLHLRHVKGLLSFAGSNRSLSCSDVLQLTNGDHRSSVAKWEIIPSGELQMVIICLQFQKTNI